MWVIGYDIHILHSRFNQNFFLPGSQKAVLIDSLQEKISPNRTSPRNHKIDTITIHCVVG
jgi:hypothetical protein